MDYANSRGIPFVGFFPINLGNIGKFMDTWAAPEPLHGAPLARHHSSILERLRKLAKTFYFWVALAQSTYPLDSLRVKHGVAPYVNPTAPLVGRHVIVTWNFHFEVPRLLSPLVHMVGIMQQPFDPSAVPQEQWPEGDVALWGWLDEQAAAHKGGVVYITFGTEVYLKQDITRKLLAGIHQYAQSVDAVVLFAMRKDLQAQQGPSVLGPGALPSTVTVMEWVHQDMVLAHPAVRAFVTHGGQGGIGEGIMNLVPFLVVPFYDEQAFNAHRVSDLGLGLWVNPHNFTPDEVATKLARVTSEPSFLAAITRLNAATRMGGGAAGRAADVIESELLLGGSHTLTPVEHRVPFWVAQGLDVLGLVGLVVLGALAAVLLIVRAVLKVLAGLLYAELKRCITAPLKMQY